MAHTNKGRKVALVAGLALVVLVAAVVQYRDELVAWYEFRRDFEAFGKNEQANPPPATPPLLTDSPARLPMAPFGKRAKRREVKNHANDADSPCRGLRRARRKGPRKPGGSGRLLGHVRQVLPLCYPLLAPPVGRDQRPRIPPRLVDALIEKRQFA